ncbi:MAG: HAMP domain-containing histidine kinase [Bacteroidia bacterium]|nr:HAMP domain-containing histidine kinase [Bacteroidia bacterium]
MKTSISDHRQDDYITSLLKRYLPIILVTLTGLMLTTVIFRITGQSDWSVVVAGLSFTGLITVYMTMVVGRASEVERTVVLRTSELEEEITSRRAAEERITEKNRELLEMQEKLSEVNMHLEERVKERTSSIEKLLKQKEDFVSQLGHDLRSPLTPLVGLVPMLQEQNPDNESQELLGVISRNVDYMKHLVEKTLQLATLTSMDDAAFDVRDVNLCRTVDDLIKRKEYHLIQNGIKIENRIREDTIVVADKLRLLEVIDNLASNAVKFMPESGCLSFDAEANDDFVKVSMRDTGIGISEEQMDHIFEEFYKADPSRHDLNSSGLGLTICKRIVEKQGGEIWAESEGVGKGTTFHFTVPAHVHDVSNET